MKRSIPWITCGVLLVLCAYLAIALIDAAHWRSDLVSEIDRRGHMIDVLTTLAVAMPTSGPDSAAVQSAHRDWLVKTQGDTLEVEAIRLIYEGGRLVRVTTF